MAGLGRYFAQRKERPYISENIHNNNPNKGFFQGREYTDFKSGVMNSLKGTACVVAAVANLTALPIMFSAVAVGSAFCLPAISLIVVPCLLFIPITAASLATMRTAGKYFKQARADFELKQKTEAPNLPTKNGGQDEDSSKTSTISQPPSVD
jgi:hypothetical protein